MHINKLNTAKNIRRLIAVLLTVILWAASVPTMVSAMVVADGQFPSAGAVTGAEWRLYDDGTLVVDSGRVNSNAVSSPWIAYNYDIEKIIFTDSIIAGTSLRGLFAGLTELTAIEGLEYFDTSNVEYMHAMFRYTDSLTSISDMSGWDVSNVTTMSGMFFHASSLTCIGDVSGWDTGNVTSMSYMFSGAGSLAQLDISAWDVSNVTTMSTMFRNADSLVELDLSGWNTGSVTNMSNMFRDAGGLETLDLSGWNTGNVLTMNSMFMNASSLENIDGLYDWDTGNVTNMAFMFSDAVSLVSMYDLSSWDVSNVENMDAMFRETTSLTQLDLSSWDTGNVTNMSRMFQNASGLEALDLSGWDTGNVTGMGNMFSGAVSLLSVGDLSGWETGNVTNMYSMFRGTINLTYIGNVSGWDTGAVTSMNNMFREANGLTALDLSGWNTANLTTMSGMFLGASSLESLDLSGWNTSAVTNMQSMFSGTVSLRQLTLGEDFINSSGTNPALPAVPNNATYTGNWQNVGMGTLYAPLGAFVLTSAQLMALMTIGGEDLADTWVWQRTPFLGIGPLSDHVFPPARVDYAPQMPHSVTVTNTGNMPTGDLTITLSGANPGSFTLSTTTIADIDVAGSASFTVVPNTGLPVGTHTAIVTVAGAGGVSQSFNVSFTVYPVLEFIKTQENDSSGQIRVLPGAVFWLYRHTLGDNGWEWDPAGGPETSGSDGRVSFEMTTDGQYKLVEESAPVGFITPPGYWLIKFYNGEFVITAQDGNPDFWQEYGVWHVSNEPVVSFRFHKTDQQLYTTPDLSEIDVADILLSGAVFQLYRFIGDGPVPNEIVNIDNLGVWELAGAPQTSSGLMNNPIIFALDPAYVYQLVEVSAPAGFNLPMGQWRITVDANGEIQISYVGEAPPAFAYEGGEWFVGNVQEFSLPLSGEAGVNILFMIAGLAIIMPGTLGLWAYIIKLVKAGPAKRRAANR